MKRAIILALTSITIVAATPITGVARTIKTRTEYGVVVKTVGDKTTIETGDGNRYICFCDDSEIGDVDKVVFDTMGTKTKKDDRVLSLRYRFSIER